MLVTFEGQRINQPVYYLSFTTVKKIFLILEIDFCFYVTIQSGV